MIAAGSCFQNGNPESTARSVMKGQLEVLVPQDRISTAPGSKHAVACGAGFLAARLALDPWLESWDEREASISRGDLFFAARSELDEAGIFRGCEVYLGDFAVSCVELVHAIVISKPRHKILGASHDLGFAERFAG